MVREGLANGVLGGKAVIFVRAMAKLRMDGIEDLLGGRRNGWVGKSVVVVVHLDLALAQDTVLRRGSRGRGRGEGRRGSGRDDVDERPRPCVRVRLGNRREVGGGTRGQVGRRLGHLLKY